MSHRRRQPAAKQTQEATQETPIQETAGAYFYAQTTDEDMVVDATTSASSSSSLSKDRDSPPGSSNGASSKAPASSESGGDPFASRPQTANAAGSVVSLTAYSNYGGEQYASGQQRPPSPRRSGDIANYTFASRRGSVADLTRVAPVGAASIPAVPSSASIATSRPGSSGFRESFMAPPPMSRRPPSSYTRPGSSGSRNVASVVYPNEKVRVTANRMQSSMLEPDAVIDKPWITKPDSRARISWWLTIAFTVLGLCAGAARIYFGYIGVAMIEQNLCLVMEDNFDGPELDSSIWSHEVDLGGFG